MLVLRILVLELVDIDGGGDTKILGLVEVVDGDKVEAVVVNDSVDVKDSDDTDDSDDVNDSDDTDDVND